MAGKSSKYIVEFNEWEVALKLLGYLLTLDNFELKERGLKLGVKRCSIVGGNNIPILKCESVIKGCSESEEQLNLFFIPIDFSIHGYPRRNVYPIFKEYELRSFNDFLQKMEVHFEIAETIYDILRDEKKYIVFFLINSHTGIQNYESPLSTRNCSSAGYEVIKQYIKNPPFMHILSAIFKCESIQSKYKQDKNKSGYDYISNIINWNNKWENIKEQIENLIEFIVNYIGLKNLEEISEFKKRYYETFVEPYLCVFYRFQNVNINPKQTTEIFDIIYKQEPKNKRHRTVLDFLRTPVPFCFWDFVEKLIYVRENLKENAELNILWIDNNASDDDKTPLEGILKSLLNINIKISYLSDININKIRSEIENREYHIILLDFFLDSEDVMVASWFIEELFNTIENKGINYWIMITSRYTPSVVKYLESGFLGGYYPNAFVYMGDFWIKKKGNSVKDWNIIFAYKFVDLLESKIKFIRSIEKEVEKYINEGFKKYDTSRDANITRNLLLKLKTLLLEIENIKNIIELRYSKDLYQLLYSYIIYRSLLPETEKDLIEEIKRRILDKSERR